MWRSSPKRSSWYGTAPPICGGQDWCLSAAAGAVVAAGGVDAEFGSMEFRLLLRRRSRPPPRPLPRLFDARPPSRLSPVDFLRDDLLPMSADLQQKVYRFEHQSKITIESKKINT